MHEASVGENESLDVAFEFSKNDVLFLSNCPMMVNRLVVISTLLLFVSSVDAILPRKDWSNLNLNDLELQWDIADDDEDELLTDELFYQDIQAKKEEKINKMQSLLEDGMTPNHPEFKRLSSEVNQAGKSAMIFAKLDVKSVLEIMREKGRKTKRNRGISSLDRKDLEDICDGWHVSGF